MTTKELSDLVAELDALHIKATPEPWTPHKFLGDNWHWIYPPDPDGVRHDSSRGREYDCKFAAALRNAYHMLREAALDSADKGGDSTSQRTGGQTTDTPVAPTFRRELQWKPGYDYRNDPEKKKYGCHGLEMRWLLHGPRATMQFLVMTPWLPSWESHSGERSFDVLPADLGYHADEPQHDGQTSRECDCRPGKICYYDGSGMAADVVFKLLVQEGEEAVWAHLEKTYYEWIKGANEKSEKSER